MRGFQSTDIQAVDDSHDKTRQVILLQPFLHRNHKRLVALNGNELVAHEGSLWMGGITLSCYGLAQFWERTGKPPLHFASQFFLPSPSIHCVEFCPSLEFYLITDR